MDVILGSFKQLEVSVAKSYVSYSLVVIVLMLLCIGCGSGDSDSEAAALIDEYEEIIDRYEDELDDARESPVEFTRVVQGFNEEVNEWSGRWNDTSGEMDPEEVGNLQRRLNKLNNRVKKMIKK